MPNMRNFNFTVNNETEEEYSGSFKCSVGPDGVFKIGIDDDSFFEYLRNRWKDLKTNEIDLATVEGRTKQQGVLSKDLEILESTLRSFAGDFIACEVKKEQVILYGYETKVHYYKVQDGTIHMNGTDAPKDSKGRWSGALDGCNRTTLHYSIGLGVHAAEKTTFIRPGNIAVEYAYHPSHIESEGGKRLNGFVGLNPMPEDKMTEIPYSDEAASFFYEMLIGMCRLADKFETFFSEKDNVLEAIENNRSGPFLLEMTRG